MSVMNIRIGFFDFTQNYGGAPKGSLELLSDWSEINGKSYVYDAGAVSKEYIDSVEKCGNIIYRRCQSNGAVVIGGYNGFISRILSVVKYIPSYIVTIFSLRQFLRRDRPRILLVNNSKSLLAAWCASAFLDVKILLYVRGRGSRQDLGLIGGVLLVFCSDAVICHSSESFENLCRFKTFRKVIYLLPNTFKVDYFCVTEPRDISVGAPIRLLLPTARVVKEKGVVEAIDAVSMLNRKYNVELSVTGALPYGSDGSFWENLENHIEESGCEKKIRFLGLLPDIENEMRSCDIVLLPSYSEGFPRVLLEAMAYCVPFIVTPVAGIEKINNEYDICRVCEIGSSKSLAAEIEQAINDWGETKKKAENGRNYFVMNNTPSIRIKKFESVIGEVLDEC